MALALPLVLGVPGLEPAGERATSDVEVVHLTVEQLDVALRESPAVAAALAAGAIRALAARLRRSEQQQAEKRQLNFELDDERRRLEAAYEALEMARLELVEQARARAGRRRARLGPGRPPVA